MAEQFKSPGIISTEEALRIEIIVNQALIDILIAKQIVSEEELIAGVREIKRQQRDLLHGRKSAVAMES